MKILKDNILLELVPLHKENTLDLNNALEKRVNEGKIIQVGELANPIFKTGQEVIFLPAMAEQVYNTDPEQLIVSSSDILAIKEG